MKETSQFLNITPVIPSENILRDANTKEDLLLGGSVIKVFVKNIQPLFKEFLERKTITKERLRLNTAWKTHEFGFYDLNNNAVFIVQSI